MNRPAMMPLIDLLKMHGLWANKALGQHFLLDSQLLSTIASYAEIAPGDRVLEVGPGPGGLTRALLAAGAQVNAIEKDERFIPLLDVISQHHFGQFTYDLTDATRYDWHKALDVPHKIVANLPYNVGSVLLMQWLKMIAEQPTPMITRLTLMFQKEVAKRITAQPHSKAYGRLSVMSQFVCDTVWHQNLPAGAFTPPPKVASSVISLVPKARAGEGMPSFAAMEKVVACAFNQRRKMLRVALKPLALDTVELMEQAGIDGTKRAENLDVDDFMRLANAEEKMAE